MDPTVVAALAQAIGPAFGFLAIGGSILGGIWISKHFKLRNRELELEAQLHTREADARLHALETRQVATEAAINALVSGLSQMQRSEAAPLPTDDAVVRTLGPRSRTP